MFSNEDSVRNRVARLENDYESIKKTIQLLKEVLCLYSLELWDFGLRNYFFRHFHEYCG